MNSFVGDWNQWFTWWTVAMIFLRRGMINISFGISPAGRAMIFLVGGGKDYQWLFPWALTELVIPLVGRSNDVLAEGRKQWFSIQIFVAFVIRPLMKFFCSRHFFYFFFDGVVIDGKASILSMNYFSWMVCIIALACNDLSCSFSLMIDDLLRSLFLMIVVEGILQLCCRLWFWLIQIRFYSRDFLIV